MPEFNVIQLGIIYIAVLNILGFLLMGIDKRKARKKLWRIPEATLFTVAIIGGALGSILGMQIFRHKTRHWYFKYGMPAILVIHILLLVFLVKGPLQVITF